jgi:phage-related protein
MIHPSSHPLAERRVLLPKLYINSAGSCPVRETLADVSSSVQDRIGRDINRFGTVVEGAPQHQHHGMERVAGTDLMEMRITITSGQNWRCLCARDKDGGLVVLSIFNKKTDGILPPRMVNQAKEFHRDWQDNRDERIVMIAQQKRALQARSVAIARERLRADAHPNLPLAAPSSPPAS